ncbi:MAG: glycoside hydrolase family 16 protein [Prevotella sp.]|nr:glycoside hydrolase family 16 protein [Prevotella sp.]
MLSCLSCKSDDMTSDEQTFPVNVTLDIDEVTNWSEVTGMMQISSGKGINTDAVEKGVCFSSMKSIPTVGDKCVKVDTQGDTSWSSVTMSGLDELTTYYVRPYFRIDDNIWYGQTQSFRTLGSSAEYYPTARNEAPTTYDGYTLVWNDEFDVDGKPGNDWTYEYGFVRNEELQWYQEDNATVKDGCLVIEGRRETVPNPNYVAGSSDWRKNRMQADYTSSCITTAKSHTFKYGRFEIRAKIPVTMGAWPAIWALGNMWEWPMNGETDILEFYPKNGIPAIHANTCWSSDKRYTAVWNESIMPYTHFTDKDSEWANKYHLWRMDWDKDFIRIYLDGELLNETDLSTTQNQGYDGNYENPFNTNYSGFGDYILLNLALGSNGGIPEDTSFPLKYKVDYVRVYQ